MRKRILASFTMLALLSACGAAEDAQPDGSPSDQAPVAGTATVTAVNGALGTFLADGDGRTLYLFTVDESGVSNCDEACLQAWPPLLTDGAPTAAGGVVGSLLGTLDRGDGTMQVTYDGWPLYFFAADAAPGDTNGQGVNDVWFVVAPDGSMISGEPSAGTSPADMGSDYTY